VDFFFGKFNNCFTGQADAVMLARQFLREPYWPLLAAHALGQDIKWPLQYERAKLK